MIPPIKEPDLAPAGLALLIIFGLLMWYDRPMESSRPFYPDVQHPKLPATGNAYESRLWEDPFGFDHPDQKKEDGGGCEFQLSKKIADIETITAQIAGNYRDDTQMPETVKKVKILAPLLKVGPKGQDIENREPRTRYRYAVTAGLLESGYRPVEPARLHFCFIQNSSGDKKYDVRWEHYESEDKPDILVAWMNSEIFTSEKPSTNEKPSPNEKPDMSEIFESKILPISKQTQSFHIYDLNNILDQSLVDVMQNKKNGNINVIKPPASGNKDLVTKLTRELELRNIKESSEVIIITEQDSENARDVVSNFRESFCDKGKNKPIMDAEPPTCEIKSVSYLKGLDAYQQIPHKQNQNEDQANKRADRLSALDDLHSPSPLPIGPSQLDYFHRLARQIKDTHDDINLEKRDSGIKAIGIFGSDFYDKLLILETLRAEMPNILVFTTDLDAQMLYPQHWRSARNLVVASHFNLLLNGKYQKEFPPFRDSQQTEIFYRTISNVTDGKVTGHIEKSPFTSSPIFEIGRNGPVRLGPVQENEGLNYLHPPDNTLEQAEERLWLLFWIIFFLICFLYAIRPYSEKLCGWLLIGTLVIFAIALHFATNESGEPFSFTDSTSLLPTIFIQIIAIFMAGAFFYRARGELDENFCRLSRQCFPICLNGKYLPICLKDCGWELSKLSWSNILPWITFIIFIFTFFIYAINDVFPSYLKFWGCLALLVPITIAYFVITEFNTEPKKDNFNYASIKDWAEKDSCHAKKNQNEYYSRIRHALYRLCAPFRLDSGHPELCQGKYEDSLWGEYYNYGLIDHRVIRVVAIWLFFAIIETILIYLLPLWPLPCRESTSCLWASGTGVTSFTVIMLLLFFILDAVRLNFHWIKKLRKQHPLLVDRITPEDLYAFINAARNNPLESLEKIVAVVAERTRVVDKLIYYPMLCIMLMLFAKITYFDNQDFPLSKGITFAASISLLFFSGFMLRYEAKKLKLSVIKSVEDLGKNNERNQTVINRINDINDGAFKPMFEQPVMRALLIILASIGLFTGEYLKLLG